MSRLFGKNEITLARCAFPHRFSRRAHRPGDCVTSAKRAAPRGPAVAGETHLRYAGGLIIRRPPARGPGAPGPRGRPKVRDRLDPGGSTRTGRCAERAASPGREDLFKPRADGYHGVAMRVVLAEDLFLLRDGLTRLLHDFGFEISAAVDNGPELTRALLTLKPDVAVVDVRLHPSFTDEGLQAALAARRRIPGLPVLVLSQHIEELYARRAAC